MDLAMSSLTYLRERHFECKCGHQWSSEVSDLDTGNVDCQCSQCGEKVEAKIILRQAYDFVRVEDLAKRLNIPKASIMRTLRAKHCGCIVSENNVRFHFKEALQCLRQIL